MQSKSRSSSLDVAGRYSTTCNPNSLEVHQSSWHTSCGHQRSHPTEHQGVLVRVHGSSGTLFDPTFLHYQISEQTRLRQISCEIFVSEGLEAAMNIDRESFNYAHPHVVYMHEVGFTLALRRVATIQRRIAADIREGQREAAAAEVEQALPDHCGPCVEGRVRRSRSRTTPSQVWRSVREADVFQARCVPVQTCTNLRRERRSS